MTQPTPRTFLVTGATKGIGLALSKRLVNAGHRVVGLARADADFPGELVTVDLGDRAATDAVLLDLTRRFAFDGVVNNVGLVKPQRIGHVDLASLDDVFAVNLHPAVQAVQALLPGMCSRRWGRVVNISSLTILGKTERTAYAAAKAALISFARSWALELADTGITVNAVAPGPTETELFRANNQPGSEGERRYLSAVPMGRFGQPDEIAATIAFLLSDEAGFMTGQTLYVDGGASIGKLAF
ncbi:MULTISPECIES: SDR family oxidoreductase [unclassified Caballeronia]|uniref:SDR family oxidoreductase n=1 Tax=unclassified Caballeronia TaxID=2646786 RepID=UPI002862E573|nr:MULTISPECIES: SDR family oxidoreductase [unclassified Caballeronia]MDR5777051.1 SDR family oxidoreductase [Caballeronia sp. LZ002]MDR5798604.1 SDR family oxidoreductase [Caballeronia sp. LZ001]MDR5852505.1 SDR family oxidoreductase [Caballeronia sp. LZ003]